MADFVLTSGKIALASAAIKSLWLANPVTNEAKIIAMDVSMDGASANTSVQFDLYIVTSIGTPAGTTGTVNKMNPNSQAATTTALVNLTTEPTTVTVLLSWMVSPFGGLFPYQLPLGREFVMAQAGARRGFRATTQTGVTPNVIANVQIEE